VYNLQAEVTTITNHDFPVFVYEKREKEITEMMTRVLCIVIDQFSIRHIVYYV